MSDKKIKKEFEDFIKELTIEICSNVCLDKIELINKTYEKNNEEFKITTKNIEEIINDNRTGIKQLNDINNFEINEMTEKYKDKLKQLSDEFEEAQLKRENLFDSIKAEFEEVTKRAIENEDTREEANEMIIDLAKELMRSHDIVDQAFNEVGEKNSQLIRELLENSKSYIGEYKKDVEKINNEERKKFIKCITDEINNQKDNFTNDIVNNTKNIIVNYLEDFVGVNKLIENKISNYIDNNVIEKEFVNINNNLNSIENKNNEISREIRQFTNIVTNKVDKDTKQIIESTNKSVDNIKSEILIVKHNLNELDQKIDDLEEKNKKIELYIQVILGSLGIIALLTLGL